jgi:hypothetical protein
MFDQVEISNGGRRITFPMPMSPGHVHGYLLPVAAARPGGRRRAHLPVEGRSDDCRRPSPAADHPAVGLYPEFRLDPLGDYVASLERVAEQAPLLALPGRGEPSEDPAGRARVIIRHQLDRLDQTLAALGPEPRSGYEFSSALFPDDRGPSQRRVAFAETLSHVERLVADGLAARGGDDRLVTYTQA